MGWGRQSNVCQPHWKAITIHRSKMHLVVQQYESNLKDIVMFMFQMSEIDSPFSDLMFEPGPRFSLVSSNSIITRIIT